MANIVAALVCIALGVFMLWQRRKYEGRDFSDEPLMPFYVKHLKFGGVILILLGLSLLVELLAYLL